MNLNDLMKKENLYKIGAIIFSLIFITGGFVFMKSHKTENNTIYKVSTLVNASVVYYDPYIILDKKINFTPNYTNGIEEFNGKYLLKVDSKEDIPKVYLELLKKGISGKANAIIKIYSFKVKNITTDEISFNQEIYPVYDLNKQIPLSITAYVSEKGVSLKEVSFYPTIKKMDGIAKIDAYDNKTNVSKVTVYVGGKTFLSTLRYAGKKNETLNITANVYVYDTITSLVNISLR